MKARPAAPSGESMPQAKAAKENKNGVIYGSQPISFTGIVDAILEVCRQRNSLLCQMRSALQSGQNDEVLALARQLCGLSHEESHRTNSRVH